MTELLSLNHSIVNLTMTVPLVKHVEMVIVSIHVSLIVLASSLQHVLSTIIEQDVNVHQDTPEMDSLGVTR